jgi:spermidine/putrescine-binding protein
VRTALAALTFAIVALAFSGCGGSDESTATGSSELGGSVVFSGFGSSTDEAADTHFFKPFTKATGVPVKIDASSEEIVAKLRAAKQAGNVPWSLIRAEEEDLVVLIGDGLIEPIPAALKAKLDAQFSPGTVTDYGVPYIDYSAVLVCDTKVVDPCPATMADFWDTGHFKGPRTMYADGWLDNLVFALEADGVPADDIFPLDVDRAFRKLDEIRDSIDVWWTNSEQAEQIFRDGEVAMGPIWSGRAALLASSDEGFQVQFDGAVQARELWVVPKGAPNAEVGFALMEWYATHPKAIAAFMTERRNGIPSPDAYKHVATEIAAALPTAPQNAANVVQVDFDWVTANRDNVFKRYQEWLTR